ncbi:VOC family protein [Amycolatopsis taiwanensis]|uniref:Glyoxalase n=1 Tax=Amycolatopsis taiwanensis TaxID=342230 RepID=A0A9W6R276_9PSEU|nr:VOC family protein [Amycolatopsis taiwanensis]GLY67093.1 glyoxalase [Amycolatopsis taiwanensis]
MSIDIPATSNPSGVPCWVELATTDEAVTRDFYGRLFGWTYHLDRDPSTPNGRYLTASLETFDASGLYHAWAGWPTGWTVRISVPSIVNAAARIEHLGGKLMLGPVDVPRRGSVVHAIDPSGAPVVLWQPPPDWDFVSGLPNTFSSADLNTRDGAATDHFFGRLFNYKAVRIGNGRSIDYVAWRLNQQPLLYRYVMGPEYHPDTAPHWVVYFEIDHARGTDATAGHALLLGGKVLIEPYDSPWGRIAHLADPTGAIFSIVDRSVTAENWSRAEVDDPYDD